MATLPRHKPALPQQWADEMALATSATSPLPSNLPPPPATTPAETLGGPLFDTQLDGFLDRFQQEIVVARALKDDLDQLTNRDDTDAVYHSKKQLFKLKMHHIRSLFSTEGEQFVKSLERRNPKLTMAACGENTIELAQGIERLETAVKEEETKRTASKPTATNATAVTVSTPSAPRAPLSFQKASDITVITPLSSPDRETSTVVTPHPPSAVGHTLNNLNSDETLQLMQSDIQALKLELMRLQRTKAHATSALPPPYVPKSMTSPSDNQSFTLSTVSAEVKSTAPPIPASILANNNVSVVRVTGRSTAPNYVSHLEQMKSRLEALEKKPLSRRTKSAARLGRTQTMGSMYEPVSADENHNPNVSAMVTPPRASRRMKHRSVSSASPLANKAVVTPPPTEHFRIERSSHSTPSPVRPGADKSSTSPARLYFDAPEDLLTRPQSHAAARDIQRYSLKVSRRLGPAEPVLIAEPRAKSAVTVSPNRRRGVMQEGGMSVGNAVSDAGGALGPPSTIDTTGSGGRVVEEIEGDMWVRKGVVWKRWRRRYASIVSHQFFGKVMCLFSYDSGGGVISTRSQIVVLHNSLCKALKEKLEIGGQERFMFVLRTQSKEYFFAAETDEIRRNWIKELKDAARKDTGRLLHSNKGRSMAFRRRT
ncbi:hypothetical protein BWQ96_08332 [Gracilariopsis chorda]|uniref:PH domain-containing protein n=1 Tax=Gracilariopsis chorda TaxID=448386 RepID=A0A2V3IIQ4_9FLOR|nr:hypothetical protein BWQ96_08332 [Gracilariopsis chorda]|eukprot:PXF41952.1 hypothetical protein BWQ96_08332 [Gracilariopsis chorda]